MIRFPEVPVDTWLSGHKVNYYYFGYLPFAFIANISGVSVGSAYNLALSTLWSLSMISVLSATLAVCKGGLERIARTWAVVLSIVFVLLSGNPRAYILLWESIGSWTLNNWWGSDGVGWSTSRVVTDVSQSGYVVETINEYPLFSFALGDLHPHVMSIPINISLAGISVLLLAYWRRGCETRVDITSGFMFGVLVGFLAIVNPWDMPFQLLLATLLSLDLSRNGGARFLKVWTPFVVGVSIPLVTFFTSYVSPISRSNFTIMGLTPPLGYSGGIVEEMTDATEFFSVWGMQILLIIVGVSHVIWSRRNVLSCTSRASGIVAMVVIVFLGWLIGSVPTILLSPIVGGGICLLSLGSSGSYKAPSSPLETSVACLVLVGCAAALLPEFFYIPDAFQSRMNTIFKFYYQAWLYWGLACGALVGWTLQSLLERFGRLTVTRFILSAHCFVLAFALSIVTPVSAIQAIESSPSQKSGFDATVSLPTGEREAIMWVIQNTDEDAIVLEAAGCSYRPGGFLQTSRVSTYTGRPTVIGWVGHERQWRNGSSIWLDEINARVLAVSAIYQNPDNFGYARIYDVEYVYIGALETADTSNSECSSIGFGPDVVRGFEASPHWELVFSNQDVQIFRRVYP